MFKTERMRAVDTIFYVMHINNCFGSIECSRKEIISF